MSLASCYDGIARMHHQLDSYRVVEEVERYRRSWMPDEVRVVLLAESHVRTSEKDFNHHWSYGTGPVHHGNFVRFVYCLANGERDLVSVASNKGTWQFWLLLSRCLNNPSDTVNFSAILRRTTPDFDDRIRKKIHLLEELKRHGIWLLDASIVGVNEEKGPIRKRIVTYSWRNHTRPILEELDPTPKHVIIVGEGVKKMIEGELHELGMEPSDVPQPQAHLRGGYSRYHNQIFETCSRFRNYDPRGFQHLRNHT